MNARAPYFQIVYNQKNITRDVSAYLESLTYEDNQEGKTDEVSITFDDSKGFWRDAWYPTKGDTLQVSLGYANVIVNAGIFEIDEIDYSGKPDSITLKAIAAVPTKQLRTVKSFVHENKTLREIVKTIADANGLTVQGRIADVRISRTTQNRESDLAFLFRLGKMYGYLFSVRGNLLTFTSVAEIDAATPVARVALSQMSRYSFKNKLIGTFAEAEATYHNVESRQTVKVVEKEKALTNQAIREAMVLRQKAENQQQAELQAKAALRQANHTATTANITLEGNPLLLAGNNVELTEVGFYVGKYQIVSSRHTISTSAYITSIECNRIP